MVITACYVTSRLSLFPFSFCFIGMYVSSQMDQCAWSAMRSVKWPMMTVLPALGLWVQSHFCSKTISLCYQFLKTTTQTKLYQEMETFIQGHIKLIKSHSNLIFIKYSNKNISFHKNIVFNTGSNKICFLITKSIYKNAFWRIMWSSGCWQFSFVITGTVIKKTFWSCTEKKLF